MSEECLAALVARLQEDSQFSSAMAAAGSAEDAAAVANAAGIAVTAEEIVKCFGTAQGNISDAELEFVAGGAGNSVNICAATNMCTAMMCH